VRSGPPATGEVLALAGVTLPPLAPGPPG